MSLNDSIIEGDTDPIPFVLEDDDGPIALQSAILVEWRMGPMRDDLILPAVIAPTVVLDDGINPALKGRGLWTPVPPQTDTPGVYAVRFRVVFPDLTQRTFPNGEPETLIIRRTTP